MINSTNFEIPSRQPLFLPEYQRSLSIPSQITMHSSAKVPLYVSSSIARTLPESVVHPHIQSSIGIFDEAEKQRMIWQSEYRENPDLFILLAIVSLKQRKFTMANLFADKAKSLNTCLAKPYLIQAIVHEEFGRLSDAINSYCIAAKLLPDSAKPFFGLAYCHLNLNDIPAAIQFFNFALEKEPESINIGFELAKLIQRSGNINEATKCFKKLIEYNPNYGPAWLQLGHIQISSGFTWKALDYFESALKVDPSNIDAYMAYGNSLHSIKQYERALLVFKKAVKLFPQRADFLVNLAATYYDLGLLNLSINSFRQVLKLTPNNHEAHFNLAKTLNDQGNLKEAEKHNNIALEICPNHAFSLNNLAIIRQKQGRVTESINLFQKTISVCPSLYYAHSNLANILKQCGRWREAIFYYKIAIELNPGILDTHLSLGYALREVQNVDGAVKSYRKAIQINPSSYIARTYLGSIYVELGFIIEAIREFKFSLMLKPNYFDAFFNLVFAQQKICDWRDYESRIRRLISVVDDQLKKQCILSIAAHHTMLYPLTPSQRLSIASQYAIFCVNNNKSLGYTPFIHKVSDYIPLRSRLRVGYVSSDFRDHPASHLIQSVLGLHNRSQIEVFCFSLSAPDGSSFRRKIESEVEHFVDFSGISSVKKIADSIYNYRVQILLNLNGYTKGARNEIFSLRPSPIQAIYLGYPGTSGAKYIDYIITDAIASPLEQMSHYSEKFAYMPNSFFIGDHANMFPNLLFDLRKDQLIKSIIPQLDTVLPKNLSYSPGDLKSIYDDESLNSYVQFHIEKREKECKGCISSQEAVPNPEGWILDRSFYGLPSDFFVFCNFNQLYKLDPNTFSCWCRILSRVPNSVLWLLRFPKAGENNLRKEAQKHGIESCRLIFTDVARKEEHVRRGQLADICLDTPLCNGHTTGMDVLWAGCPIITMPLDTFASRVGSSLLSAIGCPELITHSYVEYEELAVRLGTDRPYFEKIKKKIWLNRMTSSLFNVNDYVKDFDNLLLKIWSSFIQIKNPIHIK